MRESKVKRVIIRIGSIGLMLMLSLGMTACSCSRQEVGNTEETTIKIVAEATDITDNKSKIEDIEKESNKEKESVKKEREEDNKGDKEETKENKEEESDKKSEVSDEIKELIEKWNGKSIYDVEFWGEDIDKKLEDAGYYYYAKYEPDTKRADILRFVGYDEMVKIFEERMITGETGIEGEFLFYPITEEMYNNMVKAKKGNQVKQVSNGGGASQTKAMQVNDLVVRLSVPKTVEQIGGNRVTYCPDTYIHQKRKYGFTAYPGSGLYAVNGMLGENAESYYECKNGFVQLKPEGYQFFRNLLKIGADTEYEMFYKVETQVFKINNPNAKYTGENTEYGTFDSSGMPMWKEGFNQELPDFCGDILIQGGYVIGGKLVAEGTHGGDYSNPRIDNSDGTMNKEYVAESNLYEENRNIIKTPEGRKNIIMKYITEGLDD